MDHIGHVGIIGGAGWLGTAIARALVGSGIVTGHQLTCSYRSRKPDNALECIWTADNRRLVEQSDVIILSVRPGDWEEIEINAAGKLVISVMAGVTVESIARRTGSSRVARALPNAAAEIGYSYTPFFVASSQPPDGDVVSAILRGCGVVDAVNSEEHIDYFTAMSGSGAAFPALLANAMMNDAIKHGVPSEIARRAAQQVIVGAGRLQEWNGAAPCETVRSFVEYNGTTAAGIITMRENGFDTVIEAGLEAAFQKARALSDT